MCCGLSFTQATTPQFLFTDVLQISLELDPQGIDSIIFSFPSWRSRFWNEQGYPGGYGLAVLVVFPYRSFHRIKFHKLASDSCFMKKNKTRQAFHTDLLTENCKLGHGIITFLINLTEHLWSKGERIAHNERRKRKVSSKSNWLTSHMNIY